MDSSRPREVEYCCQAAETSLSIRASLRGSARRPARSPLGARDFALVAVENGQRRAEVDAERVAVPLAACWRLYSMPVV